MSAENPSPRPGLRRDARAALDRLSQLPGPLHLLWMMVGLLVGWWIYVPVHELLHVAGCVLTGGTVTRLELSPEYGGALLASIFDWVVPHSDYAGQLTGFDTGGSDAVYLACVYAPYLITVYPGFPAWQATLRGTVSPGRSFAFGALLPLVTAPLMSLTGDFYEFGSILASRVCAWLGAANTTAWRSDDLFLLIGELSPQATATDWLGVCLGTVIGIVFALLTLAAGSRLGHFLRRPDTRS